MAERTIVLITGGNAGIGFEAVKAFLQSEKQTYLVLMGCRSLEKGQKAVDELKRDVPSTASVVELVQVDISSDESITTAYDTVRSKYNHIDALVNNAGGQYDYEYKAGALTLREHWNKTFDINIAGTMVMTETFMSLLLASSSPRLLFLTSGLSSLSKTSTKFYPAPSPPAPGWPKNIPFDSMPYRSCKTALNMAMINWNWRLSGDGVKVWCVSPGFLATNLGDAHELLAKRGAGPPSVGGNFIRSVVEGEKDEHVGKIVHSDGHVQDW